MSGKLGWLFIPSASLSSAALGHGKVGPARAKPHCLSHLYLNVVVLSPRLRVCAPVRECSDQRGAHGRLLFTWRLSTHRRVRDIGTLTPQSGSAETTRRRRDSDAVALVRLCLVYWDYWCDWENVAGCSPRYAVNVKARLFPSWWWCFTGNEGSCCSLLSG